MKLIVSAIFVLLLLTGIWYWVQENRSVKKPIGIPYPTSTPIATPSPTITPDTLADDIRLELSKKFDETKENVIISIDQKSKAHAVGSVRVQNEGGGALWFAVRENNTWHLVYDGQQVMDCITADRFKFPSSMAAQCYDEKSNSIKNR